MAKRDPQAALGQAVRELRQAAGLTQEEAAHRAGITVGTLSVLERGKADPRWATLRALADALGVPVTNSLARGEIGRGLSRVPSHSRGITDACNLTTS